ncbi:DUF1471 domain-containing protein [Citrobacter telavivensis]
MKKLINIAIFSLFSISFISHAETVTARGDTLDATESIIAKKAENSGAQGYRIISARALENGVMISAELVKKN